MMTLRNKYVQSFLKIGWAPLFTAMLISTGTGLMMERFVMRYDGYAIMALLLTGITGNIGTILVSRTSTALHAQTSEPTLKVGAVLMSISVSVLLASVTYAGKQGYVELSLGFLVGFMICATLASAWSLYLAHWLCH